jgi:hypothetical protein
VGLEAAVQLFDSFVELAFSHLGGCWGRRLGSTRSWGIRRCRVRG